MGKSALENIMHLICHPATPAGAVQSIDVTFARLAGNRFRLRYNVALPLDELVRPAPAQPARADGLWQTTCFEGFLRVPGCKAYIEYNASPSGEWAAYHFDDYRAGMADLPMNIAPEIGNDASNSHFALDVTYVLPDVWAEQALLLGLCAIIEEAGGAKSCWALVHPSGKPDFHHGDCFVHKLAAPNGA
jgi:hypothetical protein